MRSACLLWAALTLSGGAALAGEGTTGAVLLQESFGGRPRAMGQAYVSLADDIYGMSYNPAGLSRIDKAQVGLEYAPDLLDEKLGFFGVGMPVGRNQTLGFAFSFLDAGKIDVFDAQGNLNRQVSAESDQLFKAGYAYALRDLPLDVPGHLHLGTALSFFRSSIVNELHAQATALDLGALYTRTLPGKAIGSLGLSLANLGPGVTYSGGKASGSESDPLPATIRLGGSYEKGLQRGDRLVASLQFERRQESGLNVPSLGFEYVYHGLMALRIGYRNDGQGTPISLGGGLIWKDITMDYSLSLLETFGNLHKFSLKYAFNVPWVAPRQSVGDAPSDLLIRQIEKEISRGRYLSAMEAVNKFIDLFPGEAVARKYREEIRAWVYSTYQKGVSSERYYYASGHSAYFAGNWPLASDRLRKALARERGNDEIERFLDRAEKQAKGRLELDKLKRDARISYLFELADNAYVSGENVKALKILDEILRISQYDPALKLKNEIQRAMRPRQERPVKRAGSLKPQPKPLPEPAVRQVEKAMEVYFLAIRKYSEGDLDTTIDLLEKALRLDQDSLEIQSTLQRARKERDENRREQGAGKRQ